MNTYTHLFTHKTIAERERERIKGKKARDNEEKKHERTSTTEGKQPQTTDNEHWNKCKENNYKRVATVYLPSSPVQSEKHCVFFSLTHLLTHSLSTVSVSCFFVECRILFATCMIAFTYVTLVNGFLFIVCCCRWCCWLLLLPLLFFATILVSSNFQNT